MSNFGLLPSPTHSKAKGSLVYQQTKLILWAHGKPCPPGYAISISEMENVKEKFNGDFARPLQPN
jgi:hypothetical protein